MTPITGKRNAEFENTKELFLIENLPNDLLMCIFYQVTREDLRNAAPITLVCKRWNRVIRSPVIQQLFVQRLYTHLMTDKDVPQKYFSEATDYARRLNSLSFKFAGSQKSLLVYPEYVKDLTAALRQPDDFFAALPYFDLRPFGWLQPTHWVDLISKIGPKLKNVRVLQVSDIGREIDFYKLELLHIPVAGEMLEVAKGIGSAIQDILFTEDGAKKKEMELSNQVCASVLVISSVSKKLTTLIATNVHLKTEHFKLICKYSPFLETICLDWRSFRNMQELKSEFPSVNFKTS